MYQVRINVTHVKLQMHKYKFTREIGNINLYSE